MKLDRAGWSVAQQPAAQGLGDRTKTSTSLDYRLRRVSFAAALRSIRLGWQFGVPAVLIGLTTLAVLTVIAVNEIRRTNASRSRAKNDPAGGTGVPHYFTRRFSVDEQRRT